MNQPIPPSATPAAPARRGWFQISLATLLFAVLFVAAIMGWGSAYWEKVRLQKDAHSIVHRVRVWFEAVSLDEKGKPFASHEEAINHVYGGDGGETLQLYRDLKSAEVYFSPSGQTGDPERN